MTRTLGDMLHRNGNGSGNGGAAAAHRDEELMHDDDHDDDEPQWEPDGGGDDAHGGQQRHSAVQTIDVQAINDAPSSSDADDAAAPGARTKTPVLFWGVLFMSLLAISCAGTLLRELADTPPLLKGWWRLQFVSWYLGAGFAWQWRRCDEPVRARFMQWRTQGLLLLTGFITAIHFASWIWSLQHTSLSHSLFFVCSHPLLIVFVMLVQRKPITRWEAAGVGLGLAGSVLMLLDDTIGSGSESSASSNDAGQAAAGTSGNNGAIPVTWTGDLMAFVGAVAMVGYLYSGKHCRSFLPVFLYAFPVTFVASVVMLLLSASLESGVTLAGTTALSVFGFLGSQSIGIMLLIVAGPGITGHLGIQLVLSHIPPLAISIVITVEPILGALVGMMAGVESTPHVYTIVGGPVTLVGCLLAVYGTWVREQQSSLQPSRPTNDASMASHPSTAGRHHPLGQSSPPTAAAAPVVELQELEWADGGDEDLALGDDGLTPSPSPTGMGRHSYAAALGGGTKHAQHTLLQQQDEECKLTSAIDHAYADNDEINSDDLDAMYI